MTGAECAGALLYLVTRTGLHPVWMTGKVGLRRGHDCVQGCAVLDNGQPSKTARWYLREHLHTSEARARSAYLAEFGRAPRKVRGITRPRARQLRLPLASVQAVAP
jgi:hypothetical protein